MRKRSATVVPSSVREGSGPFIAFASVGIGVNEADKQRAQEDVEVEWHGPVLDIVEVVLHPVLPLFDSVRLAADAVHLCPAGDAGFHASARHVGLDDRGILLVVLDGVRGGTDQASFATQSV